MREEPVKIHEENFRILCGDWIKCLKMLPDESVHCCVTSPPYWGLRDYGVTGQLGLEKTPEEYIAKVVAGFREVRRVLRKDGTLWLNMGDSYASDAGTNRKPTTLTGSKVPSGWSNRCQPTRVGIAAKMRHGKDIDPKRQNAGEPIKHGDSGLKPKDLIGMPWRIAFALQLDGWYLRAQCPWIKRNSMPESVRDRPGTSTETIFLLSKSERYFYDAEAVKMPAAGTAHARGSGVNPKAAAHNNSRKDRARAEHMRGPTETMNGIRPNKNETTGLRRYEGFNARWDAKEATRSRQNESFSAAVKDIVPVRGRRNHDWFMDSWEGLLTDDDGDPLAFVVNPAPFPEAHFATFPEALVKPCILAGTSEKGCCPKCGAPWKRVIETGELAGECVIQNGDRPAADVRGVSETSLLRTNGRTFRETRTTDWQASCACDAGDPIPCTVIEPFWGSGTTGKVAMNNHCKVIGIELKPEYIEMSLRTRFRQRRLL